MIISRLTSIFLLITYEFGVESWSSHLYNAVWLPCDHVPVSLKLISYNLITKIITNTTIFTITNILPISSPLPITTTTRTLSITSTITCNATASMVAVTNLSFASASIIFPPFIGIISNKIISSTTTQIKLSLTPHFHTCFPVFTEVIVSAVVTNFLPVIYHDRYNILKTFPSPHERSMKKLKSNLSLHASFLIQNSILCLIACLQPKSKYLSNHFIFTPWGGEVVPIYLYILFIPISPFEEGRSKQVWLKFVTLFSWKNWSFK